MIVVTLQLDRVTRRYETNRRFDVLVAGIAVSSGRGDRTPVELSRPATRHWGCSARGGRDRVAADAYLSSRSQIQVSNTFRNGFNLSRGGTPFGSDSDATATTATQASRDAGLAAAATGRRLDHQSRPKRRTVAVQPVRADAVDDRPPLAWLRSGPGSLRAGRPPLVAGRRRSNGHDLRVYRRPIGVLPRPTRRRDRPPRPPVSRPPPRTCGGCGRRSTRPPSPYVDGSAPGSPPVRCRRWLPAGL